MRFDILNGSFVFPVRNGMPVTKRPAAAIDGACLHLHHLNGQQERIGSLQRDRGGGIGVSPLVQVGADAGFLRLSVVVEIVYYTTPPLTASTSWCSYQRHRPSE
jgi:hypothetical protein